MQCSPIWTSYFSLDSASMSELKKEGRRNEYEMHKLLALNQRQKMVLQRKTEDANTATKKLKELLESRKTSSRETSGHNAHGIQALMQAIELELEVTVKTHEVRSEYKRQIEECLLRDKEVAYREKDLEIRDLKEKVVSLSSSLRKLENKNAELMHQNSALKKSENGHKYPDPEDITLPKCYDPSVAHADLFNPRFERFEIEGDNVDLTSGEPTHIRPPSPNYLIPSPPHQDQHQEGQQANNVFAEVVQMQDVQENAQQRQRPIRRRKRKTPETSSLKDFFTETSGHNAHGIQALMQAMELELEVTVKTHEVRSEYERQIEERAMMAKERTKLIEEQRNLSDSSEIMSPGARNSRIFALENMLATSSSTMVSTA